MAMNNFDLFSENDVSEDGKEGEDGWKRGLSVDDEEGNMVDFETVGEISDSCSAFVCMCDYDDFMASVDEFLNGVNFVTYSLAFGSFQRDRFLTYCG
jgi:hypothetical protein